MLLRGLTLVAVLSLACERTTPPPPRSAPAPAGAKAADAWNPAQIAWRGYDEGLAEAKQQRRPVCLVFFTTWCPHCANYSKVFSDPGVVEAAKQFVMIRLDADQNKEISARYAPDGEYVPRTFFVDTDGRTLTDVHADRPQYRYFYDESRPSGLLAGMQTAVASLRR